MVLIQAINLVIILMDNNPDTILMAVIPVLMVTELLELPEELSRLTGMPSENKSFKRNTFPMSRRTVW